MEHRQKEKDYYVFNYHHHINKDNGRSYKNITNAVKIEALVDVIEMLEFQLLKYKGYDEEVIHLMKLIDDTEKITIEADDKHKDKLEVCVVRLNQITSMLEELQIGNNEETFGSD
jgi:hypothetical protein